MISRCQIVYSNSVYPSYGSTNNIWTCNRNASWIKYLIDKKPHGESVAFLSSQSSSNSERYDTIGYKFAIGNHPYVSVSVTNSITSTGLALEFGAIMPYAVKVECRNYSDYSYTVVKTQTFTAISSNRISINETISGYNNVYVEFLATYEPASQVTLKHISFGRDYVFSEDIINAELNESISPEEIAINVSKIKVIKPLDISGFERGQKFYIYFPDDNEEYHLIATHTVNDISFDKYVMSFEGRCAVNEFSNTHIPSMSVNQNVTQRLKGFWLDTIDNKYTDGHTGEMYDGGFKESVSCRTAMLHICVGTGKYLDSCGGTLSEKPEIKDLYDLASQNYSTATKKYDVAEAVIYQGDKIEYTTDYKYCRLYNKTFDSSQEYTSYMTRTSQTSKMSSMKELETRVIVSYNNSKTHTMDALSAYYFLPFRYNVKYQMVDGYTDIGVITRFDMTNGDYIDAIPIKRKLNLNGQKIVCEAECIMKCSTI